MTVRVMRKLFTNVFTTNFVLKQIRYVMKRKQFPGLRKNIIFNEFNEKSVLLRVSPKLENIAYLKYSIWIAGVFQEYFLN